MSAPCGVAPAVCCASASSARSRSSACVRPTRASAQHHAPDAGTVCCLSARLTRLPRLRHAPLLQRHRVAPEVQLGRVLQAHQLGNRGAQRHSAMPQTRDRSASVARRLGVPRQAQRGRTFGRARVPCAPPGPAARPTRCRRAAGQAPCAPVSAAVCPQAERHLPGRRREAPGRRTSSTEKPPPDVRKRDASAPVPIAAESARRTRAATVALRVSARVARRPSQLRARAAARLVSAAATALGAARWAPHSGCTTRRRRAAGASRRRAAAAVLRNVLQAHCSRQPPAPARVAGQLRRAAPATARRRERRRASSWRCSGAQHCGAALQARARPTLAFAAHNWWQRGSHARRRVERACRVQRTWTTPAHGH